MDEWEGWVRMKGWVSWRMEGWVMVLDLRYVNICSHRYTK